MLAGLVHCFILSSIPWRDKSSPDSSCDGSDVSPVGSGGLWDREVCSFDRTVIEVVYFNDALRGSFGTTAGRAVDGFFVEDSGGRVRCSFLGRFLVLSLPDCCVLGCSTC